MFGFGSIVGLLHILGAIAYLAVSIAQIATAVSSQRNAEMVVRILQLIFAPSILLLSGGILLFQGWRLDPLLQFQEFLMIILIVYLVLQDLKRVKSPRSQ